MKRVFIWFAYAVAAVLAFVLITNFVVYASSRPYIYENAADAPYVQAVLIPGAPVFASGKLTPIFIDRIEQAIELYETGKAMKILVSGDNSNVDHNEVSPVRTYLLEKEIPEGDIFLDYAGFDTYSSMYRAREIFGVSSMLVATQSFHLPRAVFIARHLGIEAYGVNADVGTMLFQNYVREIFANEKALLDLFFKAKPKFLGEKIPIEGDGRNYR